MKYIYGPVKSRRLGLSLGITLVPHKICNFDCIYCQLGQTQKKINTRQEYLPIEEIAIEIKNWLLEYSQDKEKIDYISISGSGEPTLNIKLGELIQKIKTMTAIPVAVITNGSLLSNPAVRQAVSYADLVLPSLDTASQDIFKKINMAVDSLRIDEIIQGLIDFRKEYKGKIWLEVMLVRGVNDALDQIRKLKEAIDLINPDKIQLNTPVRHTAVFGIKPPVKRRLEQIKEILGERCQII